MWRQVGDRIAGSAAILVVLCWLAYGWEGSTGLTFATRRYNSGHIANASRVESTRRTTVGVTILFVPLIILYVALRRRSD